MSWLAGVVDIAKGLDRIATALERLADHAEGKIRVEPLPEAEDDPPEIAAALTPFQVDLIEQELTPLLGRRPTEDEIVRAADGVEWTEADVAAHRARVRKLGGKMRPGR